MRAHSLKLVLVLVALVAAISSALLTTASSGAARSTTKSAFGSALFTVDMGSSVDFSSPTYATIDGVTAVVAGALNGRIYVVNARTGAALPGWAGGKAASATAGGKATAIDSSPTVANLDGTQAIIVGLGSQSVPCQNGGVVAFNDKGSVLWRYRTKDTFRQWGDKCPKSYSDSVFATIAVGPVIKGQDDVVFGSFDHYMYALSPKGKLLPGFPINRADTIWSSPALVDYTKSGRDDIIEGGDASGWKGPGHGGSKCYGGWLDDYRYVSGKPKLIWEHCLQQSVWSSPAIGALTTGGKLAVVVGTSWNSSYSSKAATDELFAYYVDGGKAVKGWPVKTTGPSFGSPAIVKLTSASQPVVVSSSCADCTKGPAVVTEWSGSGKRRWSRDVSKKYEMLASPVVANVYGGGAEDVLVGITTGLYIYNGSSGDLASSGPLEDGCRMMSSPVVFPDDSSRSGYELALSCTKSGEAKLVAFNLPAPPSQAPAWPQWRGDSNHDGYPAG